MPDRIEIANRLIETIVEEGCVLFLGADLSQTITGLPSRADLAQGLAQRLGRDKPAPYSMSLAQVAQRVSRAGNRFDFTDYLRRELDTAGKPVSAFYRNLAAFAKAHSLPAIITTAYDDFLERALRDAGAPFDRVVRGSDVAFARADRLALIKLYGDVQMPDTLVVTEDDHYGLWRDRDKEALLDEVRSLLKKQTVLFLGYNLSDPDFHLLWREVLDKMGRFARTAYAVWPGLPEEEQRVWRDRMIQVLEADPWGLVEGKASVISNHPMAADLRQFLEKDYTQFTEGLNDVRVAMTGGSPLSELAATASWKEITSRFDIPEEIDTLFRMICDTRQLGFGGITRLTAEQLQSARQGIRRVLEFLQMRYPEAGVQMAKGDGQASNEHKVYGQGKAWAVLVGINHYDDPFIASLKVCVDDVTAIQKALAGRYQAARLLTDATPAHLPTRANILGELSTIAQTADEDDLLLFYFSGHGKAEGGESYLLARDTRVAAFKQTAVAMKDIREIIEGSPAHAKVIVLDACHSGASIGKAEPTMTPEFIRRVFEEAEGMAVLASCKQGQQSWELPEEGRSVFTYFLLDALTGKADLDSKGFVTVSDASRYVTDGVKTWAVDKGVPQTPTLQYAVAGDIILIHYP